MNIITNIKKLYVLAFISVLIPMGTVFGAGFTPSTATIPNPLGAGNDTITSFVVTLLDTIFPIASIVSVFFLIFSGFLMVTAGGNEEKLSKARQAFLWTVIGVAILLGAKVLSAVICGTINQLSTTHLSCPL
ncbi:MAG: pilin [Candidatus Taylorbacteria bacterium]|nr:pilin [Candidatus Taylorbacteria bacterium]